MVCSDWLLKIAAVFLLEKGWKQAEKEVLHIITTI